MRRSSSLDLADLTNPFRIALALILAAAGAWVYSPRAAAPYAFEVELTSTRRGRVQVYYDIGRGLNEADSSSQIVYAGDRPWAVRLPIPAATCRALRFDPIDNDATVALAHPRIVGPGGAVVRAISAGEWQPNDQAGTLSQQGPVTTLRPLPGCNDPNLTLKLLSPLVLKYGERDRFRERAPGFLGGAAVIWAAATLAAWGWRRRAAWEPAIRRRPQAAVLILGLASASAASYPVVFCGKSFVSPNVGTALLYENAPTVPGYSDTRQQDFRGADVGAMMWASLPLSVVESRALLRNEELPLWNRFNSCGVTLLGQGQSMLGDPLHVGVILAGGASWAWDVKFVLAKALFAAGIGLCVWNITRSLGIAALATATAPFLAFFSFRVNHPATFSLCYSPWILTSWILLARSGAEPADRKDRPGLATCLGLLLLANTAEFASGTVKEAYLLMLVLNATGFLGWLFTPAANPTAKRRTAALLAVFGAAWALAMAPLWLPFAESLKTAYTSYDTPLADQAPRSFLVGFFDDLFYRELSEHRQVYLPAGNALILLGLLAAVAQPGRLRKEPWALACLAGTAGPLLFAFRFVPGSWILALPLLRNFYYIHNFFSVAAIVPSAVLAGWGWRIGLDRMKEPRAGKMLAVVAGLMLALFAAYFLGTSRTWTGGEGFQGGWRRAPDHAFFYANLFLLLLALAALVFQTTGTARRLGLARPGWTAIALVLLLWRHGTHLPPPSELPWLVAPAVREDLAAPSPAVRFMRRDGAAGPFRAAGMDNDLFPGFAAIDGLEGINGPDAIMNARYRELAEAGGLARPGDWRFILDSPTVEKHRAFLDFLGVRYLATGRSSLPPQSGYRKVGSLDLDVYSSATAWPRAFFTDQLGRYATAADLARMVERGDGRPFAAVQDEDSELPKNYSSRLETRTVAPAIRYRLTANTTSFEIEAPGPGVVVLAETWLAGDFKAYLDGRPVPYFRVNHAFKGIRITSPGRHRIAFDYWPLHFTLALAASGISLAGLAAGLILLRERASRTGE